MALSGTLKDFGIADIFQLIGNQQKTGALVLKNGAEEVEIGFAEGNIVSATEKNRKSSRFLGAMLVRAALLTQPQLDDALSQQKRSLKRLGDILIDSGAVFESDLIQMARLQTTETAYRLFDWKSGTYEFNQREVDPGKHAFEPIRAEAILLEGFRRIDEWPAVQDALPVREATTRRLKSLDTFAEHDGAGVHGGARPSPRHEALFRLAEPDRSLQKIADLSRLGEFEALKVLHELVSWRYLELVPPARGGRAAIKELAAGGRALAQSGWLVRIAVGALCFALVFLGMRQLSAARDGLQPDAAPAAGRTAARQLLARAQLLRIEGALDVYKLEHGEYPATLQPLIDTQLLEPRDLSYPFREPYDYHRAAKGFALLPPLE